MKLDDLFLLFPLGRIYSDCCERICEWLGTSNEGQGGESRSADTCGIFWPWTVEEVELKLLKLVFMSELSHRSQVPFTEVMSSRILLLCSLWPEDPSSAYKLFSTFTTATCAWQSGRRLFPFTTLIFVCRDEQELLNQAQILKFVFPLLLPRAQRQRKSKGTHSPALTWICPCPKASCNIWETFFPFPNLSPVSYQILLAAEFKGASTDLIPVLQV